MNTRTDKLENISTLTEVLLLKFGYADATSHKMENSVIPGTFNVGIV